jgi:hypothetical protein
MANLRIISPNEVDGATLTASPAMVATLPVTNLQDQTRARVARSNAVLSGQHVLGDFVAAKIISGMAIMRHNLTATGTVRLKLYSGFGQTGTLVYDSGALSRGGVLYEWGGGDVHQLEWGIQPWGADTFEDWPVAYTDLWFAEVGARSFDLEFSDPANGDGYIEASRLFLGRYWSPDSNFSYGVKITSVDLSTLERTDGGSLRTDAVETFRRWEISLEWLDAMERARLMDIVRVAGKSADMFVSCFPTDADQELEQDYAGAVKLAQDAGLTRNYATNYRADTLVLEET